MIILLLKSIIDTAVYIIFWIFFGKTFKKHFKFSH